MLNFKNLFKLTAVLFYLSGRLLFADYSISYEVTENEVNPQGKVLPHSKNLKKSIQVHLGKTYFSVQDGKERVIYNFNTEKISRINLSEKNYENFSLFSLVSFRILEMENRLGINDVLAGPEKSVNFEPEILEHDFSIKSDRAKGKINKNKSNGQMIYSFKGTPLFELTEKGDNLSKEYLSIYIKFIRYTLGGHHEILDEMENLGKIPDEFTFYKYNKEANRYHFKLKGLTRTEDIPASLSGYSLKKQVKPDTKDYYGFLGSVEISPEVIKQKMGSIQADIRGSLDSGNYLEALLGCMESGLYTSEFDLDICKENIEDMKKDKKAGIMFNYLNPMDVTSSEDSYKDFVALEPFSGEKQYILWVFEADMLSRMGKKKESMDKFFQALEKNPYITGVYKDMGEMFYDNFNTDLAWMCWDNARSIFPENSILEPISELEKKIKSKYPEYF